MRRILLFGAAILILAAASVSVAQVILFVQRGHSPGMPARLAPLTANNAADLIKIDETKRWVYDVVFNSQGDQMVTRRFAGDGVLAIDLWTSPTENISETLRTVPNTRIPAIGFDKNNDIIALLKDEFEHDRVQAFNLTSNERVAVFPFQEDRSSLFIAGALSEDCSLAAAGSGSTVWVWDTQKSTLIVALKLDNAARTLTFSADNKVLLVGDDGGTIWTLDLPARKARQLFHPADHPISSLEFGPGDRLLAVGDQEGFIYLWSMSDRRLVTSWPAHVSPSGDEYHPVHDLAFSVDGSIVASGGLAPEARLWSVATQEKLVELPGHVIGGVETLSFSPDGKLLVTGGSGGTMFWGVPAPDE